MRRKDREITDFEKIIEIIDRCEILRIGLADGEFPYIVPLNFGYTVSGRQIDFYVHGALAGRKYELMNRNKKCSFEMDIPIKIDCNVEKKKATMHYKSVMGTASIVFLEGEEKRKAIDDIIMARWDETRHFDYNREALAITSVARLSVLELTAKENPHKVESKQ